MHSNFRWGVDNTDDLDAGMPSTSRWGVDNTDDLDMGMPYTSRGGVDNTDGLDGNVLNEEAIAECLKHSIVLGSSPFYLFPLISSKSVIQDNNELVDKFEVQRCSVEKIVNLYGSRNFYQDLVNGLVIRFDQLEESKFRPLGILSRIKELCDYFIKIGVLDGASSDLMVSELTKMGTGLYLLCPRSVATSQNCTGYIFFYSSEDRDFNDVHSMSGAVHFFRYLTQLAPKQVAILNAADLECLETFKGHKTTKRRIARKVEKMGSKEENCSAEFVGALKAGQKLNAKYLYSNTEGLSAITTETGYSEAEEKSFSVDQFLESFNKNTFAFVFHKDATVCPRFQSECLKRLRPEAFHAMVKESEDQKLQTGKVKKLIKHFQAGAPAYEAEFNEKVAAHFQELVQAQPSQVTEPLGIIVEVEPSKRTDEFVFRISARTVLHKVYHLIKTDRHCDKNVSLDVSQFELTKKGSVEFSETESLLHCTCLKGRLYLFIHNSKVAKESRISVWNVKVAGSHFDKISRRPILAAAYDPLTRILCICDDESGLKKELIFFKFSENYRELTRRYSFNLTQAINQSPGLSIALQPFSNCVWILTPQRLYKHNFEYDRNSGIVELPGNFHAEDLKMLPDGSCALVYSTDKSVFKVMCESLSYLGIEPHPSALFNDGFFTVDNQIIGRNDKSEMSLIAVTGAKHIVQTKKTDQREDGKAKYHWLEYFHWMFYKFPVQDILVDDQESLEVAFHSHELNHEKINKALNQYIENIHTSLRETGKELGKIAFFSDSVKVKEIEPTSEDFNEQPRATTMGDFLKHLIAFVPIQIARCEFNSFYTLSEGKPLSVGNAKDTIDLTNKISLGLFEAIFNTWTGPVKVVSSMGKQSTGKSYTLNHMFGSSFNISGGRCTEGCWMTVKTTKDCLYVVLDFEGLGSFERSDQEDLLMSLFNSAISHMTLFKTENRIDKDMNTMFRRFHMASERMTEVGDSFNGLFVIVIKDIDYRGIEEVQLEFDNKMVQVIGQREENFISKMYQDGYQIFPFPRFDSASYYKEIKELVDVMKDEERSSFASGTEFLLTMKLIAAKLSVNDFTPLTGQEVEARVRRLLEKLENAMKYGQLGTTKPVEEEFKLRSMDDVTQEVAESQSVELAFGGKTHKFKWDDTSFTGENGSELVLEQFSEINQTADNFKEWRHNLQLFLDACVTARKNRVKEWLETNLQKFYIKQSTDFEDASKSLWDAFRDKSHNFKFSLALCNENCSECFLKCVRRRNHEGGHQCSTDHKCKSACNFCTERKENCKLKFGHEGQHICNSVPHLCGEICHFNDKNNCSERCEKNKLHEGSHQCALKKHLCGKECSLPDCGGMCEVDCEAKHTVHKCWKRECLSQCCMEDCPNECAAGDHFHGEMLLMIKYRKEQGIKGQLNFLGGRDHFCGCEHSCTKRCERFENGFCAIRTERENVTQVFEGKRDTFEYVLKFEQKGTDKPCVKPIPPFRKNHEGGHFCSTDENAFNYCKAKCHQCSGICVKHFDHASKGDVRHKTIHGNMVNVDWTSKEEDFEFSGRKYKVGESTIAELCDAFCYRKGRGHTHFYYCDAGDTQNCPHDAVTDRRRHRPDEKMWKDNDCRDELTHDKYWETINFEDPCIQDGCNFDMCAWICDHSDHHEENKSYCVLRLWHHPVKTLSEAGLRIGWVSKGGHAYSCTH